MKRFLSVALASFLCAVTACAPAPAEDEREAELGATAGSGAPLRARYSSRKTLTDLDNAVFFASMSRLAYRTEAEIGASAASLGIERFFFFATDADMRAKWQEAYGGTLPDAQGFAALVVPDDAPNERVVVIAYRGTDSARDFLADADARMSPADEFAAQDDASVHRGFLLQTAALWDRIEKAALELVLTPEARALRDDPDALRRCTVSAGAPECTALARDRFFRPVFFTGHSLGGAVAEIAASRVLAPKTAEEAARLAGEFGVPLPPSETGLPIGGIVTFGQPRVGNQAFADTLRRRLGESTHSARAPLGESYVRFGNENDFVPMVPPQLLGYRHGGAEAWYAGEGASLAPRCSAWRDTWLQALGNVGKVATTPVGDLFTARDHGMDRYLERLGAARELAKRSARNMTCR